jgi:hypothetical protein
MVPTCCAGSLAAPLGYAPAPLGCLRGLRLLAVDGSLRLAALRPGGEVLEAISKRLLRLAALSGHQMVLLEQHLHDGLEVLDPAACGACLQGGRLGACGRNCHICRDLRAGAGAVHSDLACYRAPLPEQGP